MAPKAMKTAAMKTAMKAMKGNAKAMKAKKATKVELKERKRRRDEERNEGRDQSGGYSRVEKKEELRLKDEEIGRLKRKVVTMREKMEEMEKGKKTWGRMGGGTGVVDFRMNDGEGEGISGYNNDGWVAGYEAADEIDGGAGWGISDRKQEWVEGFMDGWHAFLAEKKREEEKKEKEKGNAKEEKGDSC